MSIFGIVPFLVVATAVSEPALARRPVERGDRHSFVLGIRGVMPKAQSGGQAGSGGTGHTQRAAARGTGSKEVVDGEPGPASPRAARPAARHPDARRLGQDIEDEEAARHPPKPGKGRGGPWLMNLTVGAVFPLKASKAPAKAGFLVTLIGGRRLFQNGRLMLDVGLAASMLTIRAKDEAVLNPDVAESERVTCKDYKGLNLWTAEAALAVSLHWPRVVVGVTALVGGGYGQYRQVKRHATGEVLACGYDEVGAWVPTVGGSLRVGWVFSKAVELSIVGGIRAVFSNRRLIYENSDGTSASVAVFFHTAHVGLSFVHRF
ncbi:MAG: hypothetical protein J7M25_04050 [Deltaproteobacteria bacterium]|nr:hypothetical protein [Deltaproteobacteria bacterium]